MGDAGVSKTYREAHLVQANTEKSEIGKGEKIAERARFLVCFEIRGESAEPRGDWIEGEHEGGGADYAERGERERLEITESEFDGEVVDGPDGHDDGDAADEDGARGAAAVGGFYVHGRGRGEDIDHWDYM